MDRKPRAETQLRYRLKRESVCVFQSEFKEKNIGAVRQDHMNTQKSDPGSF
jgi:hypothetical protein